MNINKLFIKLIFYLLRKYIYSTKLFWLYQLLKRIKIKLYE